jgi:hypothetical protein
VRRVEYESGGGSMLQGDFIRAEAVKGSLTIDVVRLARLEPWATRRATLVQRRIAVIWLVAVPIN